MVTPSESDRAGGGPAPDRRSRSPRTTAHLVGLLVAAAGAAALASALVEPRARFAGFERLVSAETFHVSAGARALLGLMLLGAGWGVGRRRKAAYIVAVLQLAALTVAHLVVLNVLAAVVTALIAAVLVHERALFVVPLPRARVGTVARVAAVVVAADVLYGLVGLAIHLDQVHPPLTLRNSVEEVGGRLIGLPGPLTVEGTFGEWFPASLTMLGGMTLVVLVVLALAPLAPRTVGDGARPAELARLLDRADGDTLDPFVMRRGKRHMWAPNHGAVLGYRYVDGVGLVAGDPVGDPADFAACVDAFLDLCARSGWRPAMVGVREDRVPTYEVLNLHALYIGDEAVIDVQAFGLAGRVMRNVRQAVNRTYHAQLRTQILREGELSPGLREDLLAIAAAQRGEFREFGYSMALGDLLTGEHPDCLIILCCGPGAAPVAFQRYVVCRRGAAVSLDAMRRRPDAPNGVHERMIVDVIDWGREHQVEEVSLNFAAFRSLLDEDAQLRAPAATTAWLLRHLDGTLGMQIDTLRRFNAKFAPRWVRRFLIYQSPLDLPIIGVAELTAEGFLPFGARR
jgi:lysyl-tRNA synthetase class 2